MSEKRIATQVEVKREMISITEQVEMMIKKEKARGSKKTDMELMIYFTRRITPLYK